MATLGWNDLKQRALPSNWDAARLTQLRLETGETYEQLLNEIAQALAAQNAALLADPLVTSLISVTTDAAMEYPIGVSNGFEDHTEYGKPDPKRAKTTGHMLPLLGFDRAFGWTWDYLRKARRLQIEADIASGMADLRNKWKQQIINRLFDSDALTIGTSGKSVPLADGGTADSTYVPPMMPDRDTAFDATHDHIYAANGITQAILETAVNHLWEHGHDGPYDLLIAQADVSTWADATAITGYVPAADPLIQYGLSQDLARVSTDYIGVANTDYGACRIRANARIPTTYWAVYKSYGPLDQRNPLRVRYNEDFGIGAVLLAGDHIREFPLEYAILFLEFGVGVADRVGAVVAENTSGSWADPTIS